MTRFRQQQAAGTGTRPLDAAALARSLVFDSDLQVTAPVTVSVGGVDAIEMDVVLAPGADGCDGTVLQLKDGTDRRGAVLDQGSRMRLHLFDMPQGSSMLILAIAVVAPEPTFEAVMDAAAPVLGSIAFRDRKVTDERLTFSQSS